MNAATDTTAIMVFAKDPIPGQVKTRLIPALGAQGAAKLHAALLEHTLQTVTQLENVALQLHCLPDTLQPFIRQCAEQHELTLHTQRGDDLGERMANAFADNLPQYQRVIVIGCDCPSLTAADLQLAITTLDQQDVVITPAHDGGYVLLGLRRFSPGIFDNIDWSTSRVLTQTREKLQALGFSWCELSPQHDIDRPEDLTHCPASLLTGVINEMA